MTHHPHPPGRAAPPLPFEPAALAHLAFAAAARRASDFARQLVPTRPGLPGHAGVLVADAVQLVTLAERVLDAAVVCERAEGVRWEEIAAAAQISATAGRGRWEPVVEQWLVDVHRATSPGQHDDADLPDELAAPPATLARELDRWVLRHREPGDPIEGEHPVTDALAASRADPATDTR
jgi:hypothetical protein